MNKIKKQFSDLRKNTPKHIQWLLLAAAFVVVLILLTLLLMGRKEDTNVIETEENIALEMSVTPDTIDWSNVIIGETKTKTLEVSTNGPVRVLDIYFDSEINGLTKKETCTPIDATSCSVVLTYSPTTVSTPKTVNMYIDWHGVNEPEIMRETSRVMLILGAVAPEIPEPEPEPVIIPEPEPVVIPEPEPEPVMIPETEPVTSPEQTQTFKQDMAALFPEDDFSFIDTPQEPEYVRPQEGCDDFAMPGYNMSGVQSGWIRPSGGAYYFYPFSDTTCSNPTGTYNPENGIITDINNPGQKIGTDAEHIGYSTIMTGVLPQLSNPVSNTGNYGRAMQLTDEQLELTNLSPEANNIGKGGGFQKLELPGEIKPEVIVGTSGSAIYSSDPFNRKFVLRQYKPIPATIVSEIRADPKLYENGNLLPVRATVDRNVYSDDGRTIVIPTGTLMLGFVTGTLPGPYQTVGRMEIKWYQFILPSGVEFNFNNVATMPFAGDSQGRAGVPGYGSTDYIEQMVLPMITAIVPAAVNMIAPIADTFVNQIDLDNNTVVQSGTIRSSELAKQEVITAWNQVAQKLIVDAMDNTVPPFSIAAGTRITVYSPQDLVITCGQDNTKQCSVENLQSITKLQDDVRNQRYDDWRTEAQPHPDYTDGSWVGQARSFNLMSDFCDKDSDGKWTIKEGEQTTQEIYEKGYDYRTILIYCESLNYQAINNVRQDVYYQDQQQQFSNTYGTTTYDESYQKGGIGSSLSGVSNTSQAYNEDVLGLTYDDSGAIQNPFASNNSTTTTTTESVLTCDGGALPDQYGCCPGEIYTDMGEQGFNCCPETGGDCFPPIL